MSEERTMQEVLGEDLKDAITFYKRKEADKTDIADAAMCDELAMRLFVLLYGRFMSVPAITNATEALRSAEIFMAERKARKAKDKG